jgi:hypothetical protein
MRKLAALLLLTVLSVATVTSAEAASPQGFSITTSAPVTVASSFSAPLGIEKTGNGTWDAAPALGLEKTANGTWDQAAD